MNTQYVIIIIYKNKEFCNSNDLEIERLVICLLFVCKTYIYT